MCPMSWGAPKQEYKINAVRGEKCSMTRYVFSEGMIIITAVLQLRDKKVRIPIKCARTG